MGGHQTPVQLHSWFIEPIRHPSSKLHSASFRVWGLPQPASKRWWRSSSIVSAPSPTRLTTRFGTSVVLNGPLCEAYANRVKMSADCIERFRSGFPSAWRSHLSEAFVGLRRSARIGDIALRRAAVPILRKPCAHGSSRDAHRVRKRVRFDVQLRPLDTSHRPQKRARSAVPVKGSDASQPADGHNNRRVLRPRAATNTFHNSRASNQRVRHEKSVHDASQPDLREPLKSVNDRTATSVKKGTRSPSVASNSPVKPHGATGVTERKARTLKTNPRTTQKKRLSDTRIAVPIEHSAQILRVRRSKRLPYIANGSSDKDKENSHPNVKAATDQSVRRRKGATAATNSKVDKADGVRRARSELGVGVQRKKSLSASGSGGEQRRFVPQPLGPNKPAVHKAESTPRRSRRIREMTSKTAQSHPENKKTESPKQVSVGSERTKAQTKAKRVEAKAEIVPSKEHVRSNDEQSSRQRRRTRGKDGPSKENTTIQDKIPSVQQKNTRTKSVGSDESKSSVQKRTARAKDIQRPKEQNSAPRKRLRSSSPTQSAVKADLREKPTELRRSSRLRAQPARNTAEDTNDVQKEDSPQRAANSTALKLATTSWDRRRPEQSQHRSHTISKKAPESERGGSIPVADAQVRGTRLRKKVSFGKQVERPARGTDDLSECKEEWTQEQREDFETQRNRVPANAPRYWESIAAGVEGKSVEQCLQLWKSTWGSPVAPKIKRVVSFTPGIADEPAEKKPKLSTPQAVRNVQKGSKTKRGRNTAKYRIAVRRLADTVARDTKDDALEPEIRTPVGSGKMTGGLFGLPDLQDGTPGTEVRQKRRNAEQGGERATPEILKRGKSFGLREADQYVSLFRQRLGNAPIVATSKKEKPGVDRHIGMKAPLNITPLHMVSEDLLLSNTQDSDDSAVSDDGDLFF